MDINIGVITHKNIKLQMPEGYNVIAVGPNQDTIVQENPTYLSDNMGQNIAYKNKNYSELTGLYYLYRNISGEIKGLVHYRRFFSSQYFDSPVSKKELDEIFDDYDIILPKKWSLSEYLKKTNVKYTVDVNEANHYGKVHSAFDLMLVFDAIVNLYPDYEHDFIDVLGSDQEYLYNMFITKSKLFDAYSEWLFSILFYVEKNKSLANYSAYQSRIYGFLSERLLNVWVRHNGLRIKELQVTKTGENYDLWKSYKDLNSYTRISSLNKAELLNRKFYFGVKDKKPFSSSFRFLEDGTIGEYDNTNEKYWIITDESIQILDENNKITSEYHDIFKSKTGKIFISGIFIKTGEKAKISEN